MSRHSLLTNVLAVAVVVCASVAALADPPIGSAYSTNKRSIEVARRAMTANKEESANAIAELRSMGPEGLRAFLEANSDVIEAAVKAQAISSVNGSRVDATAHQSNQVLSALDSICQQKDCYASRLYWYTDLDQAKSVARAQGKPILSLRLLGRLDEDLSCANSRLFRITLYANEQVSKLLRESFVLHWQSVRPVPKVTIDFGDGRKMERTLTGNSIHYVLDSEGRLIDALPGLYGPAAFVRELIRASSVANELATIHEGEAWLTALRQYHLLRLTESEKAWISDVSRAGLRVGPSREIPLTAGAGSTPPSAVFATPVAVAKAVIERPVLRGVMDNPRLLDSVGSDPGWLRIARLHAGDAKLDQATRALMTFKDPLSTDASLQAAVMALERAVAEDTVRDEYVYRARIHRWLAYGEVNSDVARLNEKIYAELFLTPSWDSWLGLRSPGSYSGIDNDGVRK